jgi:preprotein translocase subunit Sec63
VAYSLVAKPKLAANEESYDTAAPPPQDKSDPYYILGIDRSVTASELAARYKQLIKANHPDKVAQLDPEIQAFASERSRRIIEAYEAISAGEN